MRTKNSLLRDATIKILQFAEQRLAEMPEDVKQADRRLSQYIEHGKWPDEEDYCGANGWYAIPDETEKYVWHFASIDEFDNHGTCPDTETDRPELPAGFLWASESTAEYRAWGDGDRDMLVKYGFTINPNPKWWYDR